MPLTGDFGKLDQWARAIDSLASDASIAHVSRKMAGEALQLVDDSFDRQRDPFGNPWAPRKKPVPRLIGRGKTGALRKYRRKHADKDGFVIGTSNRASKYAPYFHGGKRHQLPRPIHPGSKLPGTWTSRFQKVWHAHCAHKLKGR
jgi:hypothetical protein